MNVTCSVRVLIRRRAHYEYMRKDGQCMGETHWGLVREGLCCCQGAFLLMFVEIRMLSRKKNMYLCQSTKKRYFPSTFCTFNSILFFYSYSDHVVMY